MRCKISFDLLKGDYAGFRISKYPPDKSGGITGFRFRLPDVVGYFHLPVLLVILKSEQ